MSSKEDFAVKITKGNFTKNVMDIFSSKIDCDKKYKLIPEECRSYVAVLKLMSRGDPRLA